MSGLSFNPRVTEGEIGWLAERIATALTYTLSSPNEPDSNLEPSNVVDGLYAVARGLHHIARAIEGSQGVSSVDAGLADIAAGRVRPWSEVREELTAKEPQP